MSQQSELPDAGRVREKRMTPTKTMRTAVAVALSMGTMPVFGQALDSGDTAWVTTASALVLFMTIPGLALLYGGLVRANSVLSVLLQCFSIACLVSVLWLVAGYSLAFGGFDSRFIGDFSRVLYQGMGENVLIGTVPESIFATFQLTFAIIAPALIVGAFVERVRFSSVLWFTAGWSLLVYAPVAHWIWGGGWLGQMGLLDYAGGTVVHVTAGTGALVAAMVLGPRRGFPHATKPPHSTVLALVGGAMLWVGWFGFNAGSQLAADGVAGMAMTVTHIATATAALAWMTTEWMIHGKPSVLGIATGAVAGLVAITPASGFVGPVGALAIGLASGVICYWAASSLKRKMGYDDSLDVFGVHGVGGFIGAILTGIFAAEAFGGSGLDNGIGSQLGLQFIGAAATIVYSGVLTFILAKALDATMGLRVTAEEESEGLDLALHDERGFSL